jgi:hypothetical protein
VSHRSLAAVAAATAVVTLLSACGGETAADAASGAAVVMEDDLLEGFVEQVQDMGVVEWRGQLLTKSPTAKGKRIFELSGRFSPSTGYSEVSMDSEINGVEENVDYLQVAGRTYFNSDAWGPGSAECWVDITDDTARTWGLPTELDPTWPVSASRAVRSTSEGVVVAVPAKDVITGMPRGLFPAVPDGLGDIEARATITPHGPLLEVGVDVATMWSTIPEDRLASIDTQRVGWWAMTMQESRDGNAVAPPTHVFDPQVTTPRGCTKV